MESTEKNTTKATEQKLEEIETLEEEVASGVLEPEESANSQEVEAGLQEELATANDRLLRLMAEYDNYRKRTAREKDAIYPDAVAATAEKFLPVLDNFQRALESPCTDEEFKKGMSMICDGLWEAFTALGVEPIGEVGEEFNPNRHNAVMHIDDDTLDKNVVAQVLQRGYRIGDRVLRYAMVQTAN